MIVYSEYTRALTFENFCQDLLAVADDAEAEAGGTGQGAAKRSTAGNIPDGGHGVKMEMLRLKIMELEASWEESVRVAVEEERHKWLAEARHASRQHSKQERDRRVQLLMAKVHATSDSGALALAWGVWKDTYEVEVTHRAKMRKVVRRLKDRAVVRSFQLWKQETEDGRAVQILKSQSSIVALHTKDTRALTLHNS